MNKRVLAAVAVASTAALPAVASAELTANVGWVSDYIFRGVFQEDSSPYGGVDWESNGFYVGTWWADVGNGLEADLYLGYGGETDGGFGWSVGATNYNYTEDNPNTGFYDTINEVNLGISYGIFSLDYADGKEDGWGSPTNYTFTTVALGLDNGFHASYNSWGDQYSGDYVEIGYDFSAMDLDFSFAYLYALDAGETDNIVYFENWNEVFNNGAADSTFTFGVSKTIALSK